MIVTTLKSLLTIFVLLILTACSCTPEIKYIDKPYEVKVPVKCIVPQTFCDFNKTTDTEVLKSMMECISDLKHNQEVCR